MNVWVCWHSWELFINFAYYFSGFFLSSSFVDFAPDRAAINLCQTEMEIKKTNAWRIFNLIYYLVGRESKFQNYNHNRKVVEAGSLRHFWFWISRINKYEYISKY